MPQKTSAQIQAEIDRLKAQKTAALARERKEGEKDLAMVREALGTLMLRLYSPNGKLNAPDLSSLWTDIDLKGLEENLKANPEMLARTERLPRDKAVARFRKWMGAGPKARTTRKKSDAAEDASSPRQGPGEPAGAESAGAESADGAATDGAPA